MGVFIKCIQFNDEFSVKLIQTFAKRVGPLCPFLCLLSCASTSICADTRHASLTTGYRQRELIQVKANFLLL